MKKKIQFNSKSIKISLFCPKSVLPPQLRRIWWRPGWQICSWWTPFSRKASRPEVPRPFPPSDFSWSPKSIIFLHFFLNLTSQRGGRPRTELATPSRPKKLKRRRAQSRTNPRPATRPTFLWNRHRKIQFNSVTKTHFYFIMRQNYEEIVNSSRKFTAQSKSSFSAVCFLQA